MTDVKATCPHCGHVRLPVTDVRIVQRSDEPYYMFHCPRCGGRVRRAAPEPVAALLVARGAVTVQPAP